MAKSSATASGVSAVILAGGGSRRMGEDKSQLKLGRQTLLARSVQAMAALSDDVIVVTNTAARLGHLAIRIVGDEIAGHGPLSGLHAGLRAANHAHAVVVACDLPFLNSRLLRYMIIVAPGYDAVVPHWQGEAEPLHAVYARTCLPAVEALLSNGGKRVVEFYPQVNVRYLEHSEIALFDPEGLSFFNVNTSQDWERAREIEVSWQRQEKQVSS